MTRNVLASRSWELFLANSQQGTGTSVLQAQGTEFCQQLKDPGSGFFPGPPSKSPSSHSLNHNLEIPLAKNPVSQAGFLTHGNHKIINKCCFWTAMFVVICYTAIADWYMILLLLQGSEVKWSKVTQSCLSLCDPLGCSLPGSSVPGIFQASILEWVAISFSRGSSQPRDWTRVSCFVGRRFTIWATREALQGKRK